MTNLYQIAHGMELTKLLETHSLGSNVNVVHVFIFGNVIPYIKVNSLLSIDTIHIYFIKKISTSTAIRHRSVFVGVGGIATLTVVVSAFQKWKI